SEQGIKASLGATVDVSGTMISGNLLTGVLATTATSLVSLSSSLVTNNGMAQTLTGHTGVVANNARVSLYDSTVAGNDGTGVWVEGGGGAHISNSTLTANGDYGVDATGRSTIVVVGSTVAGNDAGAVIAFATST